MLSKFQLLLLFCHYYGSSIFLKAKVYYSMNNQKPLLCKVFWIYFSNIFQSTTLTRILDLYAKDLYPLYYGKSTMV